MAKPKLRPGKFVWFEHLSRDPRKAQAFYGEVLGWSTRQFEMPGSGYDMIYVGETMTGGYGEPGPGQPAHWISYLSVDDVDASVKAATASGGRVVQAATDLPEVGRIARIADPQGAELCLFRKVTDDPVDAESAPHGGWLWNELHTTDPVAAVSFYEKVVGYTCRALDMGPSGTYHLLSRDGIDRAGVTAMLPPGTPPHWLPYVEVNDADAALERARRQGGKIHMGPHDIPGIGRFGVIEDPTGAALAVMKSSPQPKR